MYNFASIAEWIKLLSGLLVPFIALVTVYVAYQQFSLNRRQYRLALFERRMALFHIVTGFIASIVQTAAVRDVSVCTQFLRETRDHQFLFHGEVGQLIDQLYKKATELHALGAVRLNNVERQKEIVEWFTEQFKEAERVFSKYLNLRDH